MKITSIVKTLKNICTIVVVIEIAFIFYYEEYYRINSVPDYLKKYIGPVPFFTKGIKESSGFLINSRGVVLSTAHGIESCNAIRVYWKGNYYPGQVILQEKSSIDDISVLQTNIKNSSWISFRGERKSPTSGSAFSVYFDPDYSLYNVSLYQIEYATLSNGSGNDFMEVSGKFSRGQSGVPIIGKDGLAEGMLTRGTQSVFEAANKEGKSRIGFAISGEHIKNLLNNKYNLLEYSRSAKVEKNIEAIVRIICFEKD